MSLNGRIRIDLDVCFGKPVLRATRVPVSVIIGSLAVGMDRAEIETERGVMAEEIQSALQFACEPITQESFHALPRVP